MKIDLHNHTTASSACSQLEARDLILRAKAVGLDAICVTEHNTMRGGRIAEALGRELGLLVIAGQEVNTDIGDILTFGVFDEGLSGSSLKDLTRIARERGGVLIAAHPFRKAALAVGKHIFRFADAFTAVEGLNGNCDTQENGKAIAAAQELGLQITGGSDAHSLAMVGKHYTEFDDSVLIVDSATLVRALKNSKYTAKTNPLYREIRY